MTVGHEHKKHIPKYAKLIEQLLQGNVNFNSIMWHMLDGPMASFPAIHVYLSVYIFQKCYEGFKVHSCASITAICNPGIEDKKMNKANF